MTSSIRRVRRWQRVGIGFAVSGWLVAAFILLAAPAYADDCLAYHQAQQAAGQPLGPCPVPGGGSQSQTDPGEALPIVILAVVGVAFVAAAASYGQPAQPGPTPAPEMPAPGPAAPVEVAPEPSLMPKGWLAYQQQLIAQKQADEPTLSEWDWDQGFTGGEGLAYQQQADAPALSEEGLLKFQQQQIAQRQAHPDPWDPPTAMPALQHHYIPLDWSNPDSWGTAMLLQKLDDLIVSPPIWLNPHIRHFVLDHALNPHITEFVLDPALGPFKDIYDLTTDPLVLMSTAMGLETHPLKYDPEVRLYWKDSSTSMTTSEAFHNVLGDSIKLPLPEPFQHWMDVGKHSMDVGKLGLDLMNDAVKASLLQ